MSEAMQKLIDAVQKASPVIWQAAYRQVWLDGAENVLLAIFFAVAARVLYKWRERMIEKDEYHDAGEVGPVLATIGAIISVLITIPFVISSFDCFLNPTFMAIKELKGLL